MSFKGFKRADEVAKPSGISLATAFNTDLLLKSFKLKDGTFEGRPAQTANLLCEDAEGREITLYTFSRVVIDQLGDIAEQLPIIITPKDKGKYISIY